MTPAVAESSLSPGTQALKTEESAETGVRHTIQGR